MKILDNILRFICVVHNAVNHILHTGLVNVMCLCVVGEKVYLMSDMNY